MSISLKSLNWGLSFLYALQIFQSSRHKNSSRFYVTTNNFIYKSLQLFSKKYVFLLLIYMKFLNLLSGDETKELY